MKKENFEAKKIVESLKEAEKEAKKIENNVEKTIKETKNFFSENTLILIIVVLVALLAIISIFPNSLSFIKQGKEKTYSVEIIKIEGCKECFDLTLISSVLEKTPNLKIKETKTLDYASEEAKKLLDQYGIKQIPALIVLGKIDKLSLDKTMFRIEKDAGIFDKAIPSLDLSTQKTLGFVEFKEIYDSNCKECASMSKIQEQLEKLGIKKANYEIVSSSSEEGKELIEKNGIETLPTLLISKNIKEYWWIFPKIEKAFNEKESYYKFSESLYPYKNLADGKIIGKVKMTYLVNNTCTECFNVTQLKDSFQTLGVYIDSEKTLEISSGEGKALLSVYNITAIPTVVLSKEISDYTSIKDILNQVGTFEKDGNFVFRQLNKLNVKYQEIK